MNDLPKLSKQALSLKEGRCRHYSGKEYEVIGVARHSETLEELVVYKALYGDGSIWVRPLEMFIGAVDKNGRSQPRFEILG